MQLKFYKTQGMNYFTDLESVEILESLSLAYPSL